MLEGAHRRGLTLHFVSNNTEYLTQTLERLGWSKDFATVTYSREVGAEKPDPRIFCRAFSRSRRSSHAVVYVGDSGEADVPGTRAVGIPALWVDRAGAGGPPGAPTGSDLTGIRTAPERWMASPEPPVPPRSGPADSA